MADKAKYLPTDTEIKKAIEEIQKTWTQATRNKRLGLPARGAPPYEFPELSFGTKDGRVRRKKVLE